MNRADAVVLRATGLVKTYRRGAESVAALRGVDLIVGAGQIVGVSGRSGSGKSTLLAVLCGWETADSGTVRFGDGNVDPIDLPWSSLAILPQTLGLVDDLPARENVVLPARLAPRTGGPDPRDLDRRADALLQRLGVDHLADRFADEVSLGEKQRISLARALILQPRLILADEPTAHQDDGWADVMIDLLREHAAGGGASVLVSHDRNVIGRADVVVQMSDGTLSRPAGSASP